MFELSKAADLNGLVHGGQLYWGFLFSKGSLDKLTLYKQVITLLVIKFQSTQQGWCAQKVFSSKYCQT
jgi:hypothetical protein